MRERRSSTTLTTGVRTTEPVTDRLVQGRRPATLARFFDDAGYRTVLVQARAVPRPRLRAGTSSPPCARGMETFLPDLPSDFSGPSRGP